MKWIVGVVLLLVLLGGGVYWYLLQSGYFEDPLPYNPPTAEELERMKEIDQTSATQAQNAVPGTSVLTPGSSTTLGETATTTGTTTPEVGDAGTSTNSTTAEVGEPAVETETEALSQP